MQLLSGNKEVTFFFFLCSLGAPRLEDARTISDQVRSTILHPRPSCLNWSGLAESGANFRKRDSVLWLKLQTAINNLGNIGRSCRGNWMLDFLRGNLGRCGDLIQVWIRFFSRIHFDDSDAECPHVAGNTVCPRKQALRCHPLEEYQRNKYPQYEHAFQLTFQSINQSIRP